MPSTPKSKYRRHCSAKSALSPALTLGITSALPCAIPTVSETMASRSSHVSSDISLALHGTRKPLTPAFSAACIPLRNEGISTFLVFSSKGVNTVVIMPCIGKSSFMLYLLERFVPLARLFPISGYFVAKLQRIVDQILGVSAVILVKQIFLPHGGRLKNADPG